MVSRAVSSIGQGWLEADDVVLHAEIGAAVRGELTASPQVDEAVEALWPRLTPRRLLAELFGSRERIAAATPSWSERDRAALHRADGWSWTVADVAVLDEAVDLLGADDATREAAERDRRERVEYAAGVLEVLDTDEELDGEVLRAVDLVDAETLAERHRFRDDRDVVDRALEDRDWTYGHVVVDEAQELSAMDWRLLSRRCPSASMTVVGDRAQRRSPAGVRTWPAVLSTLGVRRWRYCELA